ncbi:MAG TPA: hypothetical protein VKP67_16200 [Xanthobacteraceae bacterium]|nr:hypothetical protein [Xanthobacteraceae bacterium]
MATIDRRGATVSAADPPIATNPNPDLAWKAPVRVATTGSNINLTTGGLLTIDGVALAAGNRVLVKDQTDATTNGIYGAATGPWTRAIDAQNNSQFAGGLQVMVVQGTVNNGLGFELTTADPITLGISPLTFVNSVIGFGIRTANTFFAGPSSGAPAGASFRAIVAADLPAFGSGDVSFAAGGGAGTIAAGAVTGAKIASQTITAGNIANQTITAAQIANNTITASQTAPGVSASTLFTAVMVNGTIVQSQAANAQTFAIKTLAGNDPSAADPVTFLFRNATAATGNYTVRTVTAALSITIPSGQAIGFLNATPGKVWIGALDNAGTVELFVINCVSLAAGAGAGTNVIGIYPLRGWGLISTSAVSGAASAQVAYSTTARSNVPYVPIGYATWETGGTLATAGTWNILATRMQLYQPGSTPLPGTEIQRQRTPTGASTTGTTTMSTSGIPQNTAGDQYMTQGITPTSSANVLEVDAQGYGASSVGNNISMALFQDSSANALTATSQNQGTANGQIVQRISHVILAAALSSTTFKTRMGGSAVNTFTFNGAAGGQQMGGVANSFMQVKELAA